jgi:hypothetical protein
MENNIKKTSNQDIEELLLGRNSYFPHKEKDNEDTNGSCENP